MPEQFHVPWSPKCATAAYLTEDGEGSALVVLGHLAPEALLLQEGGSVKQSLHHLFAASPAALAAQTRIPWDG